MAQFLVRLFDKAHADPDINSRLYKRGDVIDVFPDGQLAMPQPIVHWAVVQITGLSVERARALVEADVSYDNPDVPQIVRKRLRCFDWASLPTAIKNTLLNDRYYTTTLNAIRNYVKNKRTGATGEL